MLFDDNCLEEGGTISTRSLKHAVYGWAEQHIPWKTYIFTWIYFSIMLFARDHFQINKTEQPLVHEIRNPKDYVDLYSSMPSLPVTDDIDSSSIITQLRSTSKKYNFDCLAAVHIGYPLRIAYISTFEFGEIILINPYLLAGEGGEKISRGEETSAFGGRAKIKSRQFPISVRDENGYHIFTSREEAHCIMHILDVFDNKW